MDPSFSQPLPERRQLPLGIEFELAFTNPAYLPAHAAQFPIPPGVGLGVDRVRMPSVAVTFHREASAIADDDQIQPTSPHGVLGHNVVTTGLDFTEHPLLEQ